MNLKECLGRLVELLNLVLGQFLLDYMSDSVSTEDDWERQIDFVVDSMESLDLSGQGVDIARVGHDPFNDLGYRETDGPRGVALQLDDLVSTEILIFSRSLETPTYR